MLNINLSPSNFIIRTYNDVLERANRLFNSYTEYKGSFPELLGLREDEAISLSEAEFTENFLKITKALIERNKEVLESVNEYEWEDYLNGKKDYQNTAHIGFLVKCSSRYPFLSNYIKKEYIDHYLSDHNKKAERIENLLLSRNVKMLDFISDKDWEHYLNVEEIEKEQHIEKILRSRYPAGIHKMHTFYNLEQYIENSQGSDRISRIERCLLSYSPAIIDGVIVPGGYISEYLNVIDDHTYVERMRQIIACPRAGALNAVSDSEWEIFLMVDEPEGTARKDLIYNANHISLKIKERVDSIFKKIEMYKIRKTGIHSDSVSSSRNSKDIIQLIQDLV